MSTVASPVDLPFGCRILCDTHHPGPASHDGTGHRFVLVPPDASAYSYAIDVERRDLPVPEALAQALGPDAIRAWGRIEVIAKLLHKPAHLVLRCALQGEEPALIAQNGLQILRSDTADHWRVIGRPPLKFP